MKVYIASHSKEEALKVREILLKENHESTARWLNESFNKTDTYSDFDKGRIAAMDMHDVLRSDALILIAGLEKYTWGKFIEAGIAMGSGKKVIVLGRIENMLLWHPQVIQVEDVFNAMDILKELEPLIND